MLPDLHTNFSRGRSGGLVFPSLSEFSTVYCDPSKYKSQLGQNRNFKYFWWKIFSKTYLSTTCLLFHTFLYLFFQCIFIEGLISSVLVFVETQHKVEKKTSAFQELASNSQYHKFWKENMLIFTHLGIHRIISFGEGNGTPLQYSCLENPIVF